MLSVGRDNECQLISYSCTLSHVDDDRRWNRYRRVVVAFSMDILADMMRVLIVDVLSLRGACRRLSSSPDG
jgi:hypothetical protein